MGDFVWTPSVEQVKAANITRLMRTCGFEVDPADPVATQTCVRAFVRKTQRDIVWFWERALADMGLDWHQPYDRVLDMTRGPAFADWFIGGQTNIVTNCLDRHVASGLAEQTALIAEEEDGRVRTYQYEQLAERVAATAAQLLSLGVAPGERVACYLPMVTEVVTSILAIQKIGAVCVPIFCGFAAPAVRERLEDAGARVVITADLSFRRGVAHPLKAQLDAAIADLSSVEAVVVVRRDLDMGCPMVAGRDHAFWERLPEGASVPKTVPMAAMAPALMLYTSGTSGKPKATIHTHAGALAQIGKELHYHFDLRRKDVLFWLTDMGWMMGAWELIGALLHGACAVIYEGAPDHPSPKRLWEVVERHGVTVLGLSPSAIRLLMRDDDMGPESYSMSTLRILGSTGEPWDPVSYAWYASRVGHGRCPVINISGGTDILGSFLAPLPVMPIKPMSLQGPALGADVDVFDEHGNSLRGEVGYLVCKQPLPSMTRGLWHNEQQYLETYWSKFPAVWNHGDWAMVDADGDWFIFGRADDTMNIAGRRVGPGEVEAVLLGHPAVSEAAAVGVADARTGTQLVCFVVLHRGTEETDMLRRALGRCVVESLGKVDKPAAIYFVDDLPKTRSEKVLRRLIASRHGGESELGDLAHLANPEALEGIARAR